jgi:hypothetical protein
MFMFCLVFINSINNKISVKSLWFHTLLIFQIIILGLPYQMGQKYAKWGRSTQMRISAPLDGAKARKCIFF